MGWVSQRIMLVSGGGEYRHGVLPFARIADVVETKWPFQGRTCLSFVVFEGIALRRLRLRLLFFLTLGHQFVLAVFTKNNAKFKICRYFL